MLPVIIGLAGALTFGSADFLGGLAARRMSSIRVTAIVAASGLAVLLLALPIVGGAWSLEAVLYGGISGVTGAVAIALLYACLALGPMSILSPLTALVSAVVPMTAGLLRGERLDTLGYLALGVALLAVALVGFVPEKRAVRPTPKALLMATASGALMGLFVILIDLTPDDSGLVPLIANRAVNTTIMVIVVAVLAVVARRRNVSKPSDRTRLWSVGIRLALLAGTLDALANAMLLLGLRLGELTVMSVLTAMYPAGTIVLAAVVLHERLTRLQVVGLVLAVAAAGMLALA